MTTSEYTCSWCAKKFISGWTNEEAQAEARATFTEAELTHTVVVCDDCWRGMRELMPDLDKRYAVGAPSEPRKDEG